MSKRIGLLANTQKPRASEMARKIIAWGKRKGLKFLLPPNEASILGLPGLSDDEWRSEVDFAIVIGGDGTFLRASRYVMNWDIPLFGINVGNLGFLASGDPENATRDIQMILDEKHSIEERHVLEGQVIRRGSVRYTMFALNDLVLTKGAIARVIHVEVRIKGQYLTKLPADGMIVATPTGSTAYSLSAGGPIVPPHVPCFVLCPICAHTLYARPVIFSDNDRLSLIPEGDHRDLVLTQDGQLSYEILPSDRIDIRLSSEKKVKLIMLPSRSYYELLQEKLQWGQGIVSPGQPYRE